MRALSNSVLLDLWERGFGLHPLDRGLLVLSAALPEVPPASLPDWRLGRRNQTLLEIRYRCFGGTIQGWSACVSCAAKMEFELDSTALLQQEQQGRPDNQV